jgi:hypothetical protein
VARVAEQLLHDPNAPRRAPGARRA